MKEEMIEKLTIIIGHAGDSKSLFISAIKEAKANKFDEAEKKIEKAKEEYLIAHRVHTEILQKYAKGEEVETDLLQVHAQCHLLSAELIGFFTNEIVYLLKERGK